MGSKKDIVIEPFRIFGNVYFIGTYGESSHIIDTDAGLIMIDTGRAGYNGGKSQAEIIVLKYLLDNGIKELAALVITHFDNDHCGGAGDGMRPGTGKAPSRRQAPARAQALGDPPPWIFLHWSRTSRA